MEIIWYPIAQRHTAYNSIIISAPRDCPMKKELKQKRIIENNIFALKLLFRACPAKIIYTVLTTFVSVGLGLASLYIIRYATNTAEANGDYVGVFIWLLVLIAAYAAEGIIGQLAGVYITPRFDAQTNRRLRRSILEKASKCDLECYENPEFYEKYTCAMVEGAGRCESVFHSVIELIGNLIELVGAGWIIFLADPFMLVFVILPFVFSFLKAGGQKAGFILHNERMKAERRAAYSLRIFNQSNCAKEVRTSNIAKPIITRYREAISDSIAIYHKYGTRLALYYAFVNIVDMLIGDYGIYIYIAWRVLVSQTMPLGDCFVSVIAINEVLGSVYSLLDSVMEFYEHALHVENMRFLLDYQPKIAENPDAPSARAGDIVFDHVSFSYFGSGDNVIDDLSLTVHQGEKIAIVGHNGAGKTTLTKLLLRLYDPTAGSISMDGTDIRNVNLQSYRDLFATVLQDYRHFSMSVRNNVLLRREQPGDDALVTDALQKSTAASFVASYPMGADAVLDREFDDHGEVLSGGQAQMISIAHVHAKGSPIIILDEPSSALDPIAEQKMFENMMASAAGKTVVFISHTMSACVLADRIAVLDHGRLIECGSHAELMAKNGRYATLFRLQSEHYTDNGENGGEG